MKGMSPAEVSVTPYLIVFRRRKQHLHTDMFRRFAVLFVVSRDLRCFRFVTLPKSWLIKYIVVLALSAIALLAHFLSYLDITILASPVPSNIMKPASIGLETFLASSPLSRELFLGPSVFTVCLGNLLSALIQRVIDDQLTTQLRPSPPGIRESDTHVQIERGLSVIPLSAAARLTSRKGDAAHYKYFLFSLGDKVKHFTNHKHNAVYRPNVY